MRASGRIYPFAGPCGDACFLRIRAARFTPRLKVVIAHPSFQAADELGAMSDEQLAKIDLVVTSYGTLLRQSWIGQTSWRLVILDEAGRTYVRNGSVVDLQIERGQVRATVSGSKLYTVRIDIDTIPKAGWEAICWDCLGSVTWLVELLQGKISKNAMERVCREGDGLFPSPREIKMTCSCPDWADMCKHTSAVLYGVGARGSTWSRTSCSRCAASIARS